MKSSTQVYEIGFATICSNLLSFGGMLCGTFTVREKNSRALLIAADKLDRLAAYTDRITLHRSDAVSLMDRYKSADRVLLYVDPPYYEVGNSLYAVGMSPHAHSRLASWLAGHRHLSWVLSYDDHPTVRALYKSCNIARARWAYYSTKHDVNGAELIITSDTAPTFAAGRYGRMEILP
jgi:DNA adenine methylase